MHGLAYMENGDKACCIKVLKGERAEWDGVRNGLLLTFIKTVDKTQPYT